MAGYNTVCEVLGSGTPAVLVPRVGHREEQRMRAVRLATLGLVEYLPPTTIEPHGLAAAVRRALGRGRRNYPRPGLDGLDRVVRELRRLLPQSLSPRAAADRPESGPTAADPPESGPTVEVPLGGGRR
jgi:predicted glycosyltransferase